jgi:alkane 1-monooxygenase
VEDRTPLAPNESETSPGPLSFFLIYIVTGFGLLVAQRGGIFVLLAPIGVTFVAVPLFDALLGADRRNPPESRPGAFARAMYRLALWLALPVQAAILLWGAVLVAKPSSSAVEILGAIVAVGMTGGVIGINVSHELVHRSNRFDRALGSVLLVMVCYYHWGIEHVAGHHRRVATPGDPASAKLGESLPAFLVRAVRTGFTSAWHIAAGRNARRGVKSPLRNPVLYGIACSASLAGMLLVAFGPRTVLFFVAQSAVAIAFLETINYVEHYGLERRLVRPGVYERVTPLHSWNSPQWLTNVLLFNLQRHSDHHAWPTRPYYKLRHHPDAPQLPTGYAGMALLAMIPPLWRRVMDPRVEAHRLRNARIPPDAAQSSN